MYKHSGYSKIAARPPALLLAAAASMVAVSGAAVVGVPDVLRTDGLTARTIAKLLADAAPDGAREIRVNGVYGSMHEGTWQIRREPHLARHERQRERRHHRTAAARRAAADPNTVRPAAH